MSSVGFGNAYTRLTRQNIVAIVVQVASIVPLRQHVITKNNATSMYLSFGINPFADTSADGFVDSTELPMT